MLLLQVHRMLQRLRHKPIWALLLLIVFVIFLDKTAANMEEEQQQLPHTTTPEPDAAPGCRAPDIRFTVVKPETTTTQPYAKFETTQANVPDETTIVDADSVEKINIDLTIRETNNNEMPAVVNPYRVEVNTEQHHASALHGNEKHNNNGAKDDDHDDDDDDDYHDKHDKNDDHHDDDNDDDDDDANDDATDAEHTTEEDGGKSTKTNADDAAAQKRLNNKINRRSGRRRIENDNGQTRGRGSRYKRQVIHHDPDASPETDKWSGSKLAAEGDVYYVHIEDILKSNAPNTELRWKLHRLKKKSKSKTKKTKCTVEDNKEHCRKSSIEKKKNNKKASAIDVPKLEQTKETLMMKKQQQLQKQQQKHQKQQQQQQHHRRRGDSHEDKHNVEEDAEHQLQKRNINPRWQHVAIAENELNVNEDNGIDKNHNVMLANGTSIDNDALNAEINQNETEIYENRTSDAFQRVKRKSGKTTGALSRPKSGGDSSSKSTSRKDKGNYDEEGGYAPVHPDEAESEEEEEEEEEVDIQQQFTEVSEIRFPGEIGPLGDRRLCKIRCVKGKWVGPLCATNEEGKWIDGNIK